MFKKISICGRFRVHPFSTANRPNRVAKLPGMGPRAFSGEGGASGGMMAVTPTPGGLEAALAFGWPGSEVGRTRVLREISSVCPGSRLWWQ
jgi:hypothetical protein